MMRTSPAATELAVGESDPQPGDRHSSAPLHPAWAAFVRYCQELRHGEIECLKIQDGLPVLAEVTKKKVKFA
jgi:hypothetical protein